MSLENSSSTGADPENSERGRENFGEHATLLHTYNTINFLGVIAQYHSKDGSFHFSLIQEEKGGGAVGPP